MLRATRRLMMVPLPDMLGKATTTCRYLHTNQHLPCHLVGQSRRSILMDRTDSRPLKAVTHANPDMEVSQIIRTQGMLTQARLLPLFPYLAGTGSPLQARLSQGSQHREAAKMKGPQLTSAVRTPAQ